MTNSRVVIREIDLGGVKVSQVPASIGPAGGNLLLGQSFLRRLDSWSLDNKRDVLIIGKWYSGPMAFPMRAVHPRKKGSAPFLMSHPLNFLEAASGFEPLYNGFADRSLATWVCRR